MLEGKCHCGETGWTLDTKPMSVTACNCTICRRYGALWAYGYIGHDVHVTGLTSHYRRSDSGDIFFHFCKTCGCVTHYVVYEADENQRRRAAVNARMTDLSHISDLPIRHFEGYESFKELPFDGQTAKDIWF